MEKHYWKQNAGTGYWYTVNLLGNANERFYIVPGIMGNPHTLYAYQLVKPLHRGTLEQCQNQADRLYAADYARYDSEY